MSGSLKSMSIFEYNGFRACKTSLCHTAYLGGESA
jgi:hypothetical protein